MSGEHINLCFSHSDEFINRINAERAKPLSFIFNNIMLELSQKNTGYMLLTKSLLNQLLVLLIHDYNYSDAGPSVSRSHIHCIRKAIIFIDANINEKLTLSDISKIAGISPTYFSALFKKSVI